MYKNDDELLEYLISSLYHYDKKEFECDCILKFNNIEVQAKASLNKFSNLIRINNILKTDEEKMIKSFSKKINTKNNIIKVSVSTDDFIGVYVECQLVNLPKEGMNEKIINDNDLGVIFHKCKILEKNIRLSVSGDICDTSFYLLPLRSSSNGQDDVYVTLYRDIKEIRNGEGNG